MNETFLGNGEETHFSLPKRVPYADLILSIETRTYPVSVRFNQPQSDNIVFYRHCEAVPEIEFFVGKWPRRPDVESHKDERLSDERRDGSKGSCLPVQEEGTFIGRPRAEPYSSSYHKRIVGP